MYSRIDLFNLLFETKRLNRAVNYKAFDPAYILTRYYVGLKKADNHSKCIVSKTKVDKNSIKRSKRVNF